jgi:formamidopyrimidine-DNA glycosylase
MPELPEVEVLRQSLAPHLTGERIESVAIRETRLREPLERRRFESELPGRTILEVGRRAKYLLLGLDEDRTLVFHLGMSGRMTLTLDSRAPEAHEHLSMRLASGAKLRFRDPRRFGLALLLPTSTLAADRHFSHLGMEPLARVFTGDALRAAASGRRGPVKN